jgi:hypothetical protein
MRVFGLRPYQTMILLTAFSLSACRFGNRVEQVENPDQITGYYANSLDTVTYCAGVAGTPDPVITCKAVPASQVPSDYTLIMSDPVALLVTDLAQGDARLFSKAENGYYLRTKIQNGTQLGYSITSGPDTFWQDPNCFNYFIDDQVGTLTPTSGQKSAEGIKLKGSLEITFTHSRTIEGSCAATLQTMHDCYFDMAQCGGSSMTENQLIQETFQAFFEPYIAAGAMTAADIPNLVALGYEISYR